MMGRKNKRGSVIIEASIILPLLVIAVLTIAFTMKNIHYQETAAFISCNRANLLASRSAVLPVNPMFPYNLEEEITESIPEADINVNKFFTMYRIDGNDSLMSFNVRIKSNTGLPGNMTGDYSVNNYHLFRAWTGMDNSINPYRFDFQSDTIVYVMPKRGERYHRRDCPHVTPYPVRGIMSDRIRKNYRECETCDPGKIADGRIVYYFTEGEVYHKSDCITIEKYIVKMSKSEACESGYTACTQCGGI
ncbi:MAG: hypothetical protein E7225_02470 [Clostridiales bacterium]|nr:hypothetical protein [Clostridiales bacterium]